MAAVIRSLGVWGSSEPRWREAGRNPRTLGPRLEGVFSTKSSTNLSTEHVFANTCGNDHATLRQRLHMRWKRTA